MVAPTYFRTPVQTRSRVDGADRPGDAMIRCVASYRGELQEGRVVEIRVSVRQGCAPGAGPEGKPREILREYMGYIEQIDFLR